MPAQRPDRGGVKKIASRKPRLPQPRGRRLRENYNPHVCADDETPPPITYDPQASQTPWSAPMDSLQSQIDAMWDILTREIISATPAIRASFSPTTKFTTLKEYGLKLDSAIKTRFDTLEGLHLELMAKCKEKAESSKNGIDQDLASARSELAKAQEELHYWLYHRSTYPDEYTSPQSGTDAGTRTRYIRGALIGMERWREVLRRLPEFRHAGGGRNDANGSTRIVSITEKAWTLAVFVDGATLSDHSAAGLQLSVKTRARVPYLPDAQVPAVTLDYVLQGESVDPKDILSSDRSLLALNVAYPPHDILSTVAVECSKLIETMVDTLEKKSKDLNDTASILGSAAMPPTRANIESAVNLAAAASLAETATEYAWEMFDEFWRVHDRKLNREIHTARGVVKKERSHAKSAQDAAPRQERNADRDMRHANRHDKQQLCRAQTRLSEAQSSGQRAASRQRMMEAVWFRLDTIIIESHPAVHAQAVFDSLHQHGLTSDNPDRRWVYYHTSELGDAEVMDPPRTASNAGTGEAITLEEKEQRQHEWLKLVEALELDSHSAAPTSDPGVNAIIEEIISLRSKTAAPTGALVARGSERSS